MLPTSGRLFYHGRFARFVCHWICHSADKLWPDLALSCQIISTVAAVEPNLPSTVKLWATLAWLWPDVAKLGHIPTTLVNFGRLCVDLGQIWALA